VPRSMVDMAYSIQKKLPEIAENWVMNHHKRNS